MYSVYGRDGLDVTMLLVLLLVLPLAVVKTTGSANVDLVDTLTGAMALSWRDGEDAID